MRLLLCCCFLVACDSGGSSSPPIDAAVDDASPIDGAVLDAMVDGAVRDAAVGDLAVLDAAPADAEPVIDARPVDAEPASDAAPLMDAGPIADAAPMDAAPVIDAAPIVDAMPIVDAAPPPQPTPIISEFVAQNQGQLLDEDGQSSDWLELYNPGPEAYGLAEHCLSDDRDAPCRWRLPAIEIAPYGFLVIFASGKDRAPVEGPWHTDFRLSGDGEALVFADPEGVILDVIDWPGQAPDVAYGRPMRVERTPLLGDGSAVRITPDPVEGWRGADFDDAGWTPAELPLGFSAPAPVDPDNPGPLVADSVADFSGVQGQGGWSYGYYDFTGDADNAYHPDEFQPFPIDYFTGAVWDWPNGNPPWTILGPAEVHPNGINNGEEHWAIRRFTLPFAGDFVVEWTVRKTNLNGGGVTGVLMHNGAVLDSQALAGNDGVGVTRRVVIAGALAGDHIDLSVDPHGQNGSDHDFSDGSESQMRIWGAAQLGGLIATDVGELMAPGQTLGLRVPIEVPEGAMRLQTRVRFDDGVRAWVDGAPWFDSGELVDRSIAAAFDPVDFEVLPLAPGPHLLTLAGLDVGGDGQFFLAPEIAAVQIAVDEGFGYLHPSPGAPNDVDGGPVVVELARDLDVGPGDPLRIDARIAYADSATLTWQVMFGGEQQVEMQSDDGLHWRVELPRDVAEAGQMVRWFVEARDAEGRAARHPPFTSPTDSERWYGTMIRNDAIESDLPVLHWFMADPAQARRNAGGRGAMFFEGRLYDNVFANLHGQSSRGFPKKSYNIDFTKDRRFILDEDLPNMKDFNLLTNYADKSKLRNTMSYAIYRDAQVDYHLAFPMRVELNGEFHAVYDFVEDGDDRWIERLGYPEPIGPLYKMYNRLENASRGEKKTRKDEDNSDLAAFSAGIQLPPEDRRRYLFDNVDLARMANYLAGMFHIASLDCCHKNYYVYRDLRTLEWWMMPWDVDLSLGRVWTGNYFDDTMYPETPLFQSHGNRLLNALYEQPEFVEMYTRRVRTLADAIIQPPGTVDPILEARADAWLATLGADAERDNDAWATWGIEQTTAEGVRIMKEEWLALRRIFIYETLVVGEGRPDAPLPLAQVRADVNVVVEAAEPSLDAPNEAYVVLHNQTGTSVDLTGWRLQGRGIGHDFTPGTVIPTDGRMYVAAHAISFRTRAIEPTGGMGLFVQGDWTGALLAEGEFQLLAP